MFLEILIAIIIGVASGIITGLTPGIHINLIALMLLSLSGFLLSFTNEPALACFIIAMSVIHSFLDVIPSIYLGAPDSDTALGMLPGHRYLLDGKGYYAVFLTVIGSFGASILSVILFPVFVLIIKYCYSSLKPLIPYLLFATVLMMILREKNRIWALIIFSLSGVLGLIALNSVENPLFPVLSGLFGISALLISLNDKVSIPEQDNGRVEEKINFSALILGQASGFITAVMPGLSSATAAVISMQVKKLETKGFMMLIGSIGTVNFILSIATFLVINKARNGSIIAVQKLLEPSMSLTIVYLLVCLISAGIGVFLCLNIAKVFGKIISKINYRLLVISIITLIIILGFVLSGPIGLLVLFISTMIGVIPAKINISRVHSMGCLLVPVMLYFAL